MKTYKTLLSELKKPNTSTSSIKDKKNDDGKKTITVVDNRKSKTVKQDDRPKGVFGVLGSVVSGAVAAAHRHLIKPAHTKYGYQPITDYMKGSGKKKVYIETDD